MNIADGELGSHSRIQCTSGDMNMNKNSQQPNRRQDVIHTGLAGLRCSLFRTAGKLKRVGLVDESRGVTWADGRCDFELAVTVAGQSLKATGVMVSEAG